MIAVQRVPAAAEIVIIPVRRQDIIDVIVDAFERETGAVVIPLRRVVEHHIQDDLDSVLLQFIDQLLQLVPLVIVLHYGGIARVGGKEADRVVSPVVVELFPVHHPGVLHLIKLKDGHQLHRVDPQVLQIGNLLAQALIGPLGRHPGGLVLGEPSHMHLIDHQILQRRLQLLDLPPVKIILHHPGVIYEILSVLRTLSPVPLPGHGLRVGIQQYIVLVEKLPLRLIVRAVQLESVFELLDIEPEHQHRVRVPDTVGFRIFQLGERLRLLGPEQQQRTFRGPPGMNRKTDPVLGRGSAVPIVVPRPDLKSVYLVQWLQLHAALRLMLYKFHIVSSWYIFFNIRLLLFWHIPLCIPCFRFCARISPIE